MENIKVYSRLRENNNFIIENNTIKINDKQFILDGIFSNISQEDIYNNTCSNCVESVLEGYNCSIFAYGCTGTGKTYTMFNLGGAGTQKSVGIVPRICSDIFDKIDAESFSIKCSFIEIYIEKIKDLLNTKTKDLKLKQNANGSVYIKNITEKSVVNTEDILSVIQTGFKNRSTASTSLNDFSSRSHAIVSLYISQTKEDGTEIQSKIHFIDLAGSENVGKSEVKGMNLQEAQYINKSLSALSNVISALTEKGREHIPYRDSKLTYLLNDSLGGNSKTIIITTISDKNINDTLNTLNFAKRAKEIKNLPKVNKVETVSSLLKTISELQKRIAELETQKEIIYTIEENKENKESVYLQEIEKLQNKIKIQNDLFDRQRKLTEEVMDELSSEKSKYIQLLYEIEKYREL